MRAQWPAKKKVMEDWHAESMIRMELLRGKESAIQLQTLLQNPLRDETTTFDELMLQISTSFANIISLLTTSTTTACSKEQPVARKSRRGCHKRKRTSDSWTALSETIEDGCTWRKYGQKVILHSDYPRCYYRCTHKNDLGCKATKQVQIIKQDPTFYQITYFHRHTCKDSQPDSNPEERNLLSFQQNLTPLKEHSPNPIDVSPGIEDPQSVCIAANSYVDPWEDIFELDSPCYNPGWGSFSGLYQDEVVSSFQSFELEFDQLGEMDM